jgi:glycerophosphoryl diester phosphodiesterase
MLMAFFPSALAAEMPLIIAHRGASHAAPENTLAAFKLAWEEGADGIEGDFRLTADGEVVCIHDEDTKRVAGHKLMIATAKWSDLSKLDVGSWKSPDFAGERIPLLREVLDQLPAGKHLVLEIKSGPEIIPPLARVLTSRDADPARVILITFDEPVIAAARKGLPEFEIHLVSKLEGIRRRGATGRMTRHLETLGAGGLQFKQTAPVTAAWIASLHERGLKTAAWTVDKPADAHRMRALGVGVITTNRPSAVRAILEDD